MKTKRNGHLKFYKLVEKIRQKNVQQRIKNYSITEEMIGVLSDCFEEICYYNRTRKFRKDKLSIKFLKELLLNNTIYSLVIICIFKKKKINDSLNTMESTYSKKNQDYSGGNPLGNFLECSKAGIDPFDGIITRISDKKSRIMHLAGNHNYAEVVDEKLEDSLLDLAVYSLIGIIILEEKPNAK